MLTLLFALLLNTSTIITDDIIIDLPEFVASIASSDDPPEYYHLDYTHVNNINLFADGEGAKIAVIDTGMDIGHPAFEGIDIQGYNLTTEDTTNIYDKCQHGTLTTGIATKIAPKADIIAIKIFFDETCKTTGALVNEAIIYAVDNGANVISLSLGSYYDSEYLRTAISYAYDNNVFIVAAAGNGDTDEPFYPAANDFVLSVAGTDPNNEKYILSNYGEYIDVAAPAIDIVAPFFNKHTEEYDYIPFGATSAAAPQVAGIAALLYGLKSDITVDQLTEILQATAIDLGEEGKDIYFGYGLINAYDAVLMLIEKYDIEGVIDFYYMPRIISRECYFIICDN